MDHIPSYKADVFSDSEEIHRFIQYRVYNTLPTWDILILSSHLHLGLPSGVFPSGFPTKIQYVFISFSTGAVYIYIYIYICLAHFILDFVTWMLFNVVVQIAKLITESPVSCFLFPPGLQHQKNSQRKSNKMQQCIKIFYFIFIWSSTCSGRHTAHHQEPKTALAASGFAYTSNNPPRMQKQRLLVQF